MIERFPIAFAGIKKRGSIPAWARSLDATRSTIDDLCHGVRLPTISVLQSSRPKQIIVARELVNPLFHNLLERSNRSARLILGFQRSKPEDLLILGSVLREFPGLGDRVEFAPAADDLEAAYFEAMTKVEASRLKSDPLGTVKSVIKASQSLRADNGRLDAKNIAKVFGMSTSELARQIGSSRQRVIKTPDSLALQSKLGDYERIARLRIELSDVEFKIWLNTPNEHLEDGDKPIGYLKEGASAPLAAFVENMMTGAPS